MDSAADDTDGTPPAEGGEQPPVDIAILAEFLFRLGQAYLACGEQTATVELILRRAASAYGARRSRVVAFPTVVFISLQQGEQEYVNFVEGPTQVLRLDQIADIYDLGDAAQRGEPAPAVGQERLTAILRRPPQLGPLGTIVGHAILAVGVSLVLAPRPMNLLAAAILGTAVGALKVFNQDRPVLAVPLPVVAAIIVSALVFLGVSQGLPLEPLHVLIPPLVTFLPGAMLSLGMVELAYGDMVSGASRLVAGFVQLVLLAFGLAAGAALIGYQPESLVDSQPAAAAGGWAMDLAPWVGVVVFGFGVYLHLSAPPRSLGWMLLVLIAAFGAQQIAAVWFGKVASGFFGMLVATPLAYVIQLRFQGPPAMVTFLPSFWLLVPGALGLLSVKYMLSDRAAGMESLVTAVFVFTSIALGILMGAALYKMVTERLGAWQLQIGRVGRLHREGK